MENKNSDLDNKRFIFAAVFQLANGLQVFLDQHLKEDALTGKQFLLMIVVGSFGEDGATLNMVSERSGTSRQNTKQIALKLEKNGYLKIQTDEYDKRALRLTLSDKAKEYWSSRNETDVNMLNQLFGNTDSNNLIVLTDELTNILIRLREMEKENEK